VPLRGRHDDRSASSALHVLRRRPHREECPLRLTRRECPHNSSDAVSISPSGLPNPGPPVTLHWRRRNRAARGATRISSNAAATSPLRAHVVSIVSTLQPRRVALPRPHQALAIDIGHDDMRPVHGHHFGHRQAKAGSGAGTATTWPERSNNASASSQSFMFEPCAGTERS